MAKSKGINARAWFYSQSFHSSALDAPATRKRFRIEDVQPEQAGKTSGEGYDHEDFGGAFDGTRVISDADEG